METIFKPNFAAISPSWGRRAIVPSSFKISTRAPPGFKPAILVISSVASVCPLRSKTGQLFNQTHLEEKKEIAQKAIQFIQEGDSIILDSGSTTTEIAKLLMNYKDLTVITNALNIALILGENHGINLIVTGGEFKAPTLSLTGKMAADSFKDIRANKLFLATAGISSDMKLTYPSLSDLVVKSAMIESASKVYLVADCSKIGVSAFASLGSVSLANAIITDSTITEEDFERLKELEVEVI